MLLYREEFSQYSDERINLQIVNLIPELNPGEYHEVKKAIEAELYDVFSKYIFER